MKEQGLYDFISPVWSVPTMLPDGHRIWHAVTTTKLAGKYPLIAISDESGVMPQDTDDGILWLDFTEPLMMGQKVGSSIPLVTTNGERTRTPTDGITLLVLSREFDWKINAQGIFYKAVRA